MVAIASSIADRFVLPPHSVRISKARMLGFTRDDVATLVKLGIVPEDATTELLDGVIVLVDRAAEGEDILRVGSAHRKVVGLLAQFSQFIDTENRHAESQQLLNCGQVQEPQPDFMVVRGTWEQIDEDRPSAADAYCVVEVSDSSYERDSVEKLALYARAGIQQYVIINLRNRTAEVYTNPDAEAGTYLTPVILIEGQELQLRVGEGEYFSVALANLLP